MKRERIIGNAAMGAHRRPEPVGADGLADALGLSNAELWRIPGALRGHRKKKGKRMRVPKPPTKRSYHDHGMDRGQQFRRFLPFPGALGLSETEVSFFDGTSTQAALLAGLSATD